MKTHVLGPRRLAVAALLVVLAAGCSRGPADLGKVLPADTLFWLRLDRLDTLEGALVQHGLMDLVVARLREPATRENVADVLGITLGDDPRADVHALLASLRRADVTLHPARPGAATPDLRLFACLEARDAAAANAVAAILARRAAGTETWDGATVHLLRAGDQTVYLVQDAARLLVANDADLLRTLRGRLAAAPDRGLAGTASYRRVRGDRDHDLAAYLTPEFQSALTWPRGAPGAPDPAALAPLMEKYGSQVIWLGADYLFTRVVMRTALTEGSALEPLLDNPSGSSRLADWLPADTYAGEIVRVHDGARKLALVKQLFREVLAAMPAGEALPPLAMDPFATLEAGLGASLEELAGLVEEAALAAATGPGFLLLLRAASEADAERLQTVLGTSAMLGFLVEGEPREAGGVSVRTFTAPMDPEGRAIALGRKDATVLIVVAPRSLADLDAFLSGLGGQGLVAAVSQPARRQLAAAGYGWFVLDAAGLVRTWDVPLDTALVDVPPPLAARLRSLVMGAHARITDGSVSETVVEISGP